MLAAKAGLLAMSIGWLAALGTGGGWETWNDYGRWAISADRQSIVTERPARTCNSPVRVRVGDRGPDGVIVRFEQRVELDGFCTLGACIGGGELVCGETIPLDDPLPTGVAIRSVCEPDAEPVGSVPYQLAMVDSVVCSSRPE